MKAARFLAVFACVVVLGGSKASAQGADAKTREILIQKLTQVYLNLAPSDASRNAITMRLADLHAEKARVESMNELQSGCTVCNAGKEDRLKALAYYREGMAKVSESALPKVMTQVGHLYELVGKESEAVATYEKILKEQKNPVALAEANLSLAEVYFKRRNYSKARDYFKAVLENPQSGSKGLAAYRIAWCDFNEGRNDAAIEGIKTVLNSPALLSRSASADVVQIDPQFHEEVSRDLATFLAKRPLSVKDGELVYSLSPESARISNATYLAAEAERVGQIPAAIALWRFVGERQAKPQSRLEGHIHLASLEMNQKLLTDAIRDFESALGLWSQIGKSCETAECKELHARLRKFVLDWNRVGKKAPSPELLAAYKSYLKVFPAEGDMTIWAAKVASDNKDYAGALALYNEGAEQAQRADSRDKENADRLEAALLGGIESAELSKEPALLHRAYDAYIGLSRAKTKTLEVRYQKAHLLYDKGENEAAATALREIALAKDSGQLDIKKQAADLSLDALVLLKDDARLEAWSADYARAFPKEAKEFAGISSKSVLTQATQQATSGDMKALSASWETLTRFDLASASPEEKATFYKNKLILAEKLGKLREAREAVDQLLRLPNLAAADQQYALTRKAWLAELVLDFDTALAASEKITSAEFKGDKKWLKLAMFAELASKDAKPFYSQFLKESKDDEKNAAIAAQLVRDAKDPLKEIDRNRVALSKRPELLGALYLEIYGKTGSSDVVKRAMAAPGVAQTSAGKVFARSSLLEDVSKLRAKIEAHQIDGNNQRKMAAGLKARVAMLDESEKLAGRAVESGDWTSQLVALDLLAKQNDRFYQEILSLPVPQGLSSEEEQQYLTLLSQQAAPHQLRAQDVAKKTAEFWQNEKAMDQLAASYVEESGGRRSLIAKELKALADVAPAEKKTELLAVLEKPEPAKSAPKLVQIEGARQAVRENPMSRSSLESLLALEKQMGHSSMVAYLEGRLSTLGDENSQGVQ